MDKHKRGLIFSDDENRAEKTFARFLYVVAVGLFLFATVCFGIDGLYKEQTDGDVIIHIVGGYLATAFMSIIGVAIAFMVGVLFYSAYRFIKITYHIWFT